jgi:hypothetical protein
MPVFAEKQSNLNDKYIVIEKTGGDEENYISTATVAIQSYANSLYEAALLSKEVKHAMKNIVELDNVSKAKLNSDYNFTDTTKKQYRYQAVYDLVFFD